MSWLVVCGSVRLVGALYRLCGLYFSAEKGEARVGAGQQPVLRTLEARPGVLGVVAGHRRVCRSGRVGWLAAVYAADVLGRRRLLVVRGDDRPALVLVL